MMPIAVENLTLCIFLLLGQQGYAVVTMDGWVIIIAINARSEESAQMVARLCLAMTVSVLIALVLAPEWAKSYAVIHTVLEVFCITIALSSFFVVWCVSEIQQTNLVLGFGFLTVAIFDTLHTLLWQGLGLFPDGYYDLSAKYWLAGRFFEALFLILSTTPMSKLPINRWAGLIFTLVFSFSLALALYYTPHALPLLLTPQGVTPLKIVIEYVIILMFIYFLFRIYTGHFQEDMVTKEFLMIAILMAVPAELCFTVFTTITDFYNVLGHVLKISYYYFFLRAVFAGFVVFPYKKLRLSEERFQKAFHMNPSMMMISTLQERVFLDVNDSFAKLVGLSREEIIGRSTDEINRLSEADNREVRQILLSGGKLYNREVTYKTSAGEARTVLASTDTILLDNTLCVLTVATDITYKHRFEREMARLDCLNLVGELAAGIGHEVRNPMTTVRGYLQMFQRKGNFSAYHEQFSTMIEELDRANTIITEFLSLAKEKDVEMKRGNLNKVIHSLLPLLQAEAFRIGHAIRADLDDIPDSDFNEKEIRQILLNLVRNGFEAMEHSGEVIIRTYRRDDNIMLSVQDTGSGIPAEVVSKLGTPFVTTKEDGTGLGLPVCYRIAERHNAKIDLDTGPWGTTFTVIFHPALSWEQGAV
jgi:PAS domain S-box-containing protein